MKFKILIAVLFLVVSCGVVFGQSYMAEDGVFIYREVENYTLNGFNFTIPADYELTMENETHMFFKSDNNTLNLSVVDGGKIKKVKSKKNVTSSETMLGSVEGYLVDRNGSYTFSFKENKTLITVSSKDMTLMMGVMGRD